MPLLIIDTAINNCACAIFADDKVVLAEKSLALATGHAEALLPLLATCLTQAGIAARELTKVAVTIGPGSFTGLRGGIAAARTIAFACHGIPCVGVSTLKALALSNARSKTLIIAAIDALNSRAYYQPFITADANQPELLSPLSPPDIDNYDIIAEHCHKLIVADKDADTIIIAGTGAHSLKQRLNDQNKENDYNIIMGGDIIDLKCLAALVVKLDPQLNPAKPLYIAKPA